MLQVHTNNKVLHKYALEYYHYYGVLGILDEL